MTTQAQISQLSPAATPLTGDEQIPLDQDNATVRASVAQVRSPVFTETENGLVPAPESISGKVLSDDGTWVAQSGGGGDTLTNWVSEESPLPTPTFTANTGVLTASCTGFGIAYGNGTWVATALIEANTTTILTSPDGITWTENDQPDLLIRGSGVYFVNNAFWMLNNTGEQGGQLIRSTDGLAWTEVLAPTTGELLLPPGWDGTHFAIPETGTVNWHTSEDGITWTAVNGTGADSFDSNFAYGAFGGENVWMAGVSHTSPTTTPLAVSTDITNASGWVYGNVDVPLLGENSLFATTQGAFAYTSNGTSVSHYGYDNWLNGDLPISPTGIQGSNSLCQGDGMLCVVGLQSFYAAGNGLAAFSADGGNSWSPIPYNLPGILGDSPAAVAYGNGKFICLTAYGQLFSYTPPS